jgi:sirohydrochlorin ferrochelatase
MSSTRLVRAALISAIIALVSSVAIANAERAPKPGILLLAHGGKPAWNERVTALASQVSSRMPIEVAFGMASRPSIQAAVDRLVAAGVTEIVAVPLFVSDHSSVVTSTAYLLGLRSDMPDDLPTFAKMNHGSHGAATHAAHGATSTADAAPADAAAPDPTSPIASPVPIRMTPALGRHPIVAEILATRARSISRAPAEEAVVLVAHGPVEDEENRRWVEDMRALAAGIHGQVPFASVDALTVRDDAPEPVKEAATKELRHVVESRTREGRRVLVVPLLLSYGGIEQGIRKRLDGLTYVMPEQGLTPDDRLATWILAMAQSSASTPTAAGSR